LYNDYCCGMIAMKREVATGLKSTVGFPWSECQEGWQGSQPKEPDGKSLYKHMSVKKQKHVC